MGRNSARAAAVAPAPARARPTTVAARALYSMLETSAQLCP